MLPATGVQTSIWNNNIKSVLLLAAYPFILGGVIFCAAWTYGYAMRFGMTSMAMHPPSTQELVLESAQFATGFIVAFWPYLLAIVAVWFIVSYFTQGVMIRALSHGHPVTRTEEPDLYNLLENLCIAEGLSPMPRLEIIETRARNAFASGTDTRSYCVTVTRGLMQSLTKDELEAVLAHELTHIINRDVRLMMVCILFTGLLGFAAQLVWSTVRRGLWVPSRSSRSGRSGGLLLALFLIGIVLWVGYLATILTRFAISRRREYMADAGAVQMTRNPEAMMRALLRISGAANIPQATADIRALCFENRVPFLGLMATHPPIEERINMIATYSGLPIPDIKPKSPAGYEHSFSSPTETEIGRENWTTRQRFSDRKNPWR